MLSAFAAPHRNSRSTAASHPPASCGRGDRPLSLLPAPFPVGQVVDFYAAAWPNFTPALTGRNTRLASIRCDIVAGKEGKLLN
jgi:hypothetical protein